MTLTGTYLDGSGAPATGSLTFVPSAPEDDSADQLSFRQDPVHVALEAGRFSVRLLATDNPQLAPSGWAWTVTERAGPAATWSFFLPYSGGATQDISALAPVSDVTTMAAFLPLDYPPGAGAGKVWTSDAGGNGSWQPGIANPMTTLGDLLGAGAGGAPQRLAGNTAGTRKFLRSAGSGGNATLPTWDTLQAGDIPALPYDAAGTSAAETTRAEAAEALLAPLASPALTGSPTAPTAPALTNSARLATTAYADSAVAAETGRATTAEGLLAPKASPALTGTPTAPTAAALTDSTQIATTAYADAAVAAETARAETAEGLALARASNLSDLASAATARTNLGLTGAATAALPLSIANGGSGQATQQAAIDALTGTQSAGKVLRSDGTHATLAAIQGGDLPAATTSAQGAVILDGTAGDIAALGAQAAGSTGKAADAGHVHPTAGLVTSVTAADTSVVVGGTGAAPTVRTGALDVIAADHPPAADWSNNSHKITSLANGSAAQDAAAFGQIPTSAGSIGGLLAANSLSDVASAVTARANLGAATDTAVVHLAGTETISGAKTFSLAPAFATQSVTGTATLGAASAPVVLTDTTAAAFTLTLPAIPVTGEWFILIDDTGKWDASALTVAPNGKNIDGSASSQVLTTQWGKLWLYYDGTAWWTLAAGAWTGTPATATYTLFVDRTGALPVYSARSANGQVVALAADTATTSGLKAVLTSIAPNNTDDFSIRLMPGSRYHFLDAPLGTESWAGTEDHFQFVGNNNVTLEGAGFDSIISNYTNFTGSSPDPQPLMLFGCSRWKIRNLTVESCGISRAPSNTINGDGLTNSVIQGVRVRAAIGHAIAIDGGYNGQWGGNTVVRDCLIQGRPAAPTLTVGSGGTLTVQTYQYATAWRCNGLGVFTATGTSSGTTATITTGSAHSYQTGDSVSISGMSPAGYNGTFTITVTGSATFTYVTAGSNLGAGSGGTAIGADVTKPSDQTAAVTSGGNQKVTVNLTRGPYSCVGRVIYRYDGTNWLQVGTVNDNTTATFVDSGITGSAVTFAHKSVIQGAGIEIMASNGCVVDGNVIDGTGDMVNGAASSQNGIHVVQKAVGAVNVPADHNTIVNNVVRQTGSHAVRVVGGSNNIISGNQVSNPGTPSVKAQAIRLEGIASASTNSNTVTGNNTWDDQTAASWAGGASTSNSISITATNTPTGNVIGPNVMTGYTSSSPVSDSGTSSLLEADEKTIVLMAQGTLSVTTKVSNFNFACPWPGTIKRARLYVDTAPTGQALICDFLLNGTTIWTTSGNRVQIAASANSGTQTTFNTTAFNAGDVFTFNIAQVGSGTPGANLVMELTVLASRVYP